jgi:hypothetical protein
MGIKKPITQRLKKLESSDLLSLKDSNGDFLVFTKQETTRVIREFIQAEFEEELKQISINLGSSEKSKIEKKVKETLKRIEDSADEKIKNIEASIDAFIQYKFDLLSEKVCDLLINRKFEEEVNKKVEERLKKRGKF